MKEHPMFVKEREVVKQLQEKLELKPCPFCGGKAEFQKADMLSYRILCKDCPASSGVVPITISSAKKQTFVENMEEIGKLCAQFWNQRVDAGE